MKRTVISIDEAVCNGCGLCVSGCHEGALQMIDGKARIINETFCDGLGACIGECPVGAIKLEEKEAKLYDENAVMEKLVTKGEKTIIAHLKHLKEHNEMGYYNQGLQYLKEHNISVDMTELQQKCGCAGSKEMSFTSTEKAEVGEKCDFSYLTQWPIQLHLVNPQASFFKDSDFVLAADCIAYAFGNFHHRFLKNRSLAIACPKLDVNKEQYIEKLATMIEISKINTLTVIIMEVPCCMGLLQIAEQAISNTKRKIPIKKVVIGIKGSVLEEEWQ